LKLTYIKHEHIDKKEWDLCINNAINKLVYAESVYLDKMCGNWDAIILNDYEAVMPLPWKIKFGIKYLYQPAFYQQGGIYSRNKISEKTTERFILEACSHFKFSTFSLNYGNPITASPGSFKIIIRNNFILDLQKNYESLSASYSPYLKRKLKKSITYQLKYKVSDDIHATIEQFKSLYKKKIPSVRNIDYTHFEELCIHFAKEKKLFIREVYDATEKRLLAAVLMIKDSNRIYNLVPCLFPAGKKLSANYFLYDSMMKEFSGQQLVFDFEGSDIEGIAFFYRKFTDNNQPYPFIRFNNLPKIIRWIKG